MFIPCPHTHRNYFDTRIIVPLLQLYVGDKNFDGDEMQYIFALELLDLAYPVGGSWTIC